MLLDIGLPDRDGYEVCHMIRMREYETSRRIPFISLTGYGDPVSPGKCIKVGKNEVMAKPLDEERLIQMINRLKFFEN